MPSKRKDLSRAVPSYFDIFKLVWPIALGMVNSAVMQFVDRAYLARHSMVALEAILPATTLAWIFMSFFQSVVGYSGVFVSQYYGAQDNINTIRSYRAGLLMALISGLLMFPLIPLGDFIFSLTAASTDIFKLEKSYYNIVIACGFFVFGQMAVTSYFTGRGKTRIVFWVSLLGNIINIIVDPILIFGWGGVPEMGIKGAAYATVGSLIVQFVILLLLARRDIKSYAIDLKEDFSKLLELIRQILRFGIPSGAYDVLNMASFTIFVFITGRVGDVAFAASNACFTVNYLLYAPVMGFAIGAQTLVGQCCGRGDTDAARIAAKKTLLLGLCFVVASCAAVALLHKPLLLLFAPSQLEYRDEFMSVGFLLLILMGAWMVFDATDTIVSGALKGAGDTKFVMAWMFIASFIIWLPVVFIVARFHNTMPALWATMVGYVLVICTGTLIRWKCGKWKKIVLLGNMSKK
ncbi:MAG: MATE family efflux transporter [Kiritimatiellae bacterium]|nr:MATE family efflux transporter [Kiritimatiellia bacterium]